MGRLDAQEVSGRRVFTSALNDRFASDSLELGTYDAINRGSLCAGAAIAMLTRCGYEVLLSDRSPFPSDIHHGQGIVIVPHTKVTQKYESQIRISF